MSTPYDTDVLIVGGGPNGLALALDLGARGIRSILIERDPGTGTEMLVKADLLNERSMEYFRHLGLVEQIANAGFPDDVSRDTVYCTALNGKFIGRDPMPSTRERKLPDSCVEMHRRCPQFWLDPMLAREVLRRGQCEIRYSTALVSLSQDEDGVTATVSADDAPATIRSRYVVGCDGAASVVRRQLGIAFAGDQLDYSLSAVVRAPDLPRYHPLGMGERYMFIGPDGTWANLTSVEGRELYRFTVLGSNEPLDPAKLDMHALLRRAFGRDGVPYELMRVVPWRRSRFAAERFHSGRVFLAGDSAHTTSPTGGHGLNTGLGDVMDVAWMLQALLEGWGGPQLGPAYTAERRRVAIRNGNSSTRNYSIWVDKEGREKILDDGPEADAQRRLLGERLRAALRQEWHSLGVAMGYRYDDSPIVVPDGSPQTPDEPSEYVQTARPGHRAPHAWLADGRSTVDLFFARFVLLHLGQGTPDYGGLPQAAKRAGMPLTCMAIEDSAIAALYETRLALVRPDGMVAWRGDSAPADAQRLIDQVRGCGPG